MIESLTSFLEFEIFRVDEYSFKVYTIVSISIIFVVTKLVLWVISKTLFGTFRPSSLDKGNSYALMQIIRYVIWIISIGFMLETVGIKVTVLIAGSAALLVGVGLGLQQTFNDFISGIILLSEGTTRVGDVLEVEGEVIQIESIGLRTSKGLNRSDIIVIIPNSMITSNRVINWTHQSEKTRFKVSVGVAYGSDVQKVIRIIEEAAISHPNVIGEDSTEGRFVNFGNSSLDFQVLFYSTDVFRIEKVKSDIRIEIEKRFRAEGITIPFPQMDVYIKEHAKG